MATKSKTQTEKIGKWTSESLMPFFAEHETTMLKNKSEELFIDIWRCFAKNSCALFELLPMKSTSYQIAQTMRLLVELTADSNFIANRKENIAHLKKKTNKLIKKCERETDVSKWRKYIADARNINLLVGRELANKVGEGTKKRVENVFGKKFYNFYSSYAHVNMFVVRDDVHRLADDSFIGAQRWELIKDYPLVLEKFIHIVGEAINDPDLAEMDCSSLTNGFEKLFP